MRATWARVEIVAVSGASGTAAGAAGVAPAVPPPAEALTAWVASATAALARSRAAAAVSTPSPATREASSVDWRIDTDSSFSGPLRTSRRAVTLGDDRAVGSATSAYVSRVRAFSVVALA